jgi:hypothetical protein
VRRDARVCDDVISYAVGQEFVVVLCAIGIAISQPYFVALYSLEGVARAVPFLVAATVAILGLAGIIGS